MANTTYTYSIPVDMPDGSVNTSTLHEEISSSSIAIALDSIDTDGTSLEIVFKAELPTADRTILDGDTTAPAGGILAAHDNSPSIDPVQTVILDSSARQIIEIQEEAPGDLLYHNFKIPVLNIEADSTEGYTDLILPFDFYFLAIEYWAGAGSGAKYGDLICSAVDPQRDLTTLLGPYGDLEADASAGQDEIQISTVAIQPGLIQLGYMLQFGDTTSKVYTVASIDKTTGVATLSEDLSSDATSGCKIYRTICLGNRMHVFPSNVPIEYGAEKTGGSKLPAGWPFRIHYIACDSTGREIRANIMGAVHEV